MRGLLIALAAMTAALPALADGQSEARLGEQAAQAGRNAEAIEHFNSAIQSGELSEGNLTLTLMNRGIVYFRMGKYERAVRDYSRVIARRDDWAAAYSNRCYALGKKGDYANALDDCNRALALEPDYRWGLGGRGLANFGKREYQAAVDDLTRALEIGPPHPDNYYYRGLAYEALGEKDKALADFRQAVELDPDAREFRAKLMSVEKPG